MILSIFGNLPAENIKKLVNPQKKDVSIKDGLILWLKTLRHVLDHPELRNEPKGLQKHRIVIRNTLDMTKAKIRQQVCNQKTDYPKIKHFEISHKKFKNH